MTLRLRQAFEFLLLWLLTQTWYSS